MQKFPADLARAVTTRWPNIVAGESYKLPTLPPPKVLRRILECGYLAAATQEEGRFPQFNLLVVHRGSGIEELGAVPFKFEVARSLDISELRRLAPAADMKKSSVWVEFDDDKSVIVGLADLGTSWHRARSGFIYNYNVPNCLVVQVDRPGRMKVFQGQFHVATLADGDLSISQGIDFHLFLHASVHKGQEILGPKFSVPEVEEPRDFTNFWFTAHWNVFAAIANSISLSGHGGAIIIADRSDKEVLSCLRIKYCGEYDALKNAFIAFINARNATADYYELAEREGKEVSEGVFKAEVVLITATEELAEAIRFVAQLASCDGAIVISPDFQVLGFGAEIRAEMNANVGICDVINEMRKKYSRCDIEQFGMRHRSAVKLASRQEGVVVIPISQDGPISGVWREKRMFS